MTTADALRRTSGGRPPADDLGPAKIVHVHEPGLGLEAGLVGCFAVMRRMTLASDAISHVALPGIGIAWPHA